MVEEKPNGNIRICTAPKNLNEVIQRERFPMQTRDDIMAEMAGAQYFAWMPQQGTGKLSWMTQVQNY